MHIIGELAYILSNFREQDAINIRHKNQSQPRGYSFWLPLPLTCTNTQKVEY